MRDDHQQPETVDVDRERGITITFADGRTCFFANDELRDACPCATCRGQRDAGERVWPPAGVSTPARIEGASLVGAWGINVRWVDGHDTGIYPWAALRAWCDDASNGDALT